jgi:putative transposase
MDATGAGSAGDGPGSGLPVRRNSRAAVFSSPDDHAAFLTALRQIKKRYPFRLYAYCLMTDHFHLVLEPHAGRSISRILQSLTVAHTWRRPCSRKSIGTFSSGRLPNAPSLANLRT